jgi:hypothetical protein
LYAKGKLRRKRGEIPRRAFVEEGNFRREILGAELSEGSLCRGESLRRGIFEAGYVRRGMFRGEFSLRSIFAVYELSPQRTFIHI